MKLSASAESAPKGSLDGRIISFEKVVRQQINRQKYPKHPKVIILISVGSFLSSRDIINPDNRIVFHSEVEIDMTRSHVKLFGISLFLLLTNQAYAQECTCLVGETGLNINKTIRLYSQSGEIIYEGPVTQRCVEVEMCTSISADIIPPQWTNPYDLSLLRFTDATGNISPGFGVWQEDLSLLPTPPAPQNVGLLQILP